MWFDSPDTARSRSYFTVVMETAPRRLEPIFTGTYDDWFARVDGAWRFTERREGETGIGNAVDHLLIPLDVTLDH